VVVPSGFLLGLQSFARAGERPWFWRHGRIASFEAAVQQDCGGSSNSPAGMCVRGRSIVACGLSDGRDNANRAMVRARRSMA
jgi:hypothetical protein